MQPSDSLPSLGVRSGSPRGSPTLAADAYSSPTTRVSADACSSGIGQPDPRTPGISQRRGRASQVSGPSIACVPWSSPPRRTRRLLALYRWRQCCLRRRARHSASGILTFRGCFPTAHTLAYLRIAGAVTVAVARLAADPPGSALVGQDSHLLDDYSEFRVRPSQASCPLGPGSPGRTARRASPLHPDLSDKSTGLP